jgi:steroid delta-isomerase-like uncharacterized protein
MSMELESLVRTWFDEVWNKKHASAIDEMLSDETVHHGLGGWGEEIVRGVDGFKLFHQQFLAAFPDLNFEIEEVMTDDERIAIRYTLTGTHLGDAMGIPATNRKIKIAGGGIGRAKDGKFTDVFNLVDFFTMYSQLGAFPAIDRIG